MAAHFFHREHVILNGFLWFEIRWESMYANITALLCGYGSAIQASLTRIPSHGFFFA